MKKIIETIGLYFKETYAYKLFGIIVMLVTFGLSLLDMDITLFVVGSMIGIPCLVIWPEKWPKEKD